MSQFRWPWEPRRYNHRCAMLPVAVQIGKRTETVGGMMSAHATDVLLETSTVLRRCECGQFDSVTILGQWTLDQIQGKDVASETAAKFMESLK